MLHRSLVVVVALFAFSAFCADGITTEIEKPFLKWDTALNEGKPEALLDLVTDDFDRVAPAQPHTVGKTAFLDVVKPYFVQVRFEDSKHVIESIVEEGDSAAVKGSWSAKIIPLSGDKPYISKAKWSGTVKRQGDGTFKVSQAEANGSEIAPISE